MNKWIYIVHIIHEVLKGTAFIVSFCRYIYLRWWR